nr:radical SAM protein [uncultured Roseateles sp.]
MNEYQAINLEKVISRLRPDIPSKFNELHAISREKMRLLANLQGANPPPYEVLIHPSSACNLQCEWCIGEFVPTAPSKGKSVAISSKIGDTRLPDKLANPDSMIHLLKGICEFSEEVEVLANGVSARQRFRVEAVSFSGLIGEPLVAKKALMRGIPYLSENGVRVGLFTNGILIDDQASEILQMADYVLVSLDAATEETYGRIKFGGRPQGHSMFRKALEGLGRLIQARSASSKTTVNASFIICQENVGELFAAAKIAKEIGVQCFRIKQDNSGSRKLTAEAIVLAKDQMARIEADLVDDKFTLVRIHRELAEAEILRDFSKCEITNLVAAVGSDGHMYPCNYHPRPGGMSYGDTLADSFKSVWRNERRMEMRELLPERCPPTCDPFKNRANHLLAPMRSAHTQGGEGQALQVLATLLEAARPRVQN